MRAIVVTQLGGPEVLREQEMPMPVPGEHDLLIEVHACSINPIDFKIRRGAFAKNRALPFILGYDVSGVVRGVGEKVEGFHEGNEVYSSPSLILNGSNAEFVCVDARLCALKPKSLSHTDAAALPLVTLTAWEGLLKRARIEMGQTVLIHAGGGGVGHVAIQIAKLNLARVITTASRRDSLALCRKCGADVVINYREEDFVERVKAETDGRGCDIVFDTVGGETFDRSLDCVAVDGHVITCVGTPSDRIPQKLFRLNASLHFEFKGAPGVYGVRPESHGEILHAAALLVDQGQLIPYVSRVLQLDELAEGHRLIETAQTTGKIVVSVR